MKFGSFIVFVFSLFYYICCQNDTKEFLIKKLDEKIMRKLENPKKGSSIEVLKLIHQYYNAVLNIKEMIEKSDKKVLMAARQLYSDGGPSILSFTMDDEKMEKVGWTNEAFKTYYKLRIYLDATWTELRRMLYE